MSPDKIEMMIERGRYFSALGVIMQTIGIVIAAGTFMYLLSQYGTSPLCDGSWLFSFGIVTYLIGAILATYGAKISIDVNDALSERLMERLKQSKEFLERLKQKGILPDERTGS